MFTVNKSPAIEIETAISVDERKIFGQGGFIPAFTPEKAPEKLIKMKRCGGVRA